MRNLKKVLALVLAMAMSLSLAVTAGAAFNDQDKIVNEEAVDMCVALNIINGRTNGDFDPAGNVTRAEAAKMICIALNGGKEPVLSASATSAFADINGHWAAKYIEYCVSLGIVAGKSATQFDPNGNVTGTELAKMLLIATGYDADTEKFVGKNWDTNVNVIASQKNLYKELEAIDPAVALSRDNAAQMIWNALNAIMVEYDYALVSENGTLTSKLIVKDIKNADLDTLLEVKFGAKNTTGILEKITYSTKNEEYSYYFATAEGKTAAEPFVTEADYTDLLGMKVTFVTKGTDVKDVFGAFAKDSEVVATGIYGDIEFNNDGTMEVAGVEYDCDGYALKEYDGDTHHAATLKTVQSAAAYYEFAALEIDDGDDDIDVIVVYPVELKDVTYVGSDYVKLNKVEYGTDAEESEYTVYDGVAKEDVVLVTDDMTLKTWGDIAKMDAVSGKVESVTQTSDTAVVDGTAYDYSTAAIATESKTADQVMVGYLDKNIEFYAINGYMFKITADVATDLGDFVILADVTEAAGLGGYVDAEIVFTDGTSEVVKAKPATGTTLAKDRLYTFDVEDGKYELTSAVLTTNEFDVVGNDDFNPETNNPIAWTPADKDADTSAKIASYKFAADAVVLVKTEDGYVLKTGADLAKVTDAKATVNYYGADLDDKTNVTSVAFAVVVTEGTTVSEWQYGFVTSDVETKTTSDGNYSILTVWNGAPVDLTTDAGVVADTAKGGVVMYKVNEEGLVSDIKDLSKVKNGAVAGAVTMIDGEEITVSYVGGVVPFTVDAEDTVVIYVDKSENAGAADSSIILADKADTEGEPYINNVYIYDGTFDKTLEVIVVDVDNEWK